MTQPRRRLPVVRVDRKLRAGSKPARLRRDARQPLPDGAGPDPLRQAGDVDGASIAPWQHPQAQLIAQDGVAMIMKAGGRDRDSSSVEAS